MTFTLYTQYFNPKISRSKGRRIKKSAAENFTDQKLHEILRSINAKYEIRDARYPRVPWEEAKMFVVESKLKKSTVIKMIERKLS
ncbi:signal recognition particle [uncultured archaeon]|nr:signal recognition particle [uncultured archaeon]